MSFQAPTTTTATSSGFSFGLTPGAAGANASKAPSSFSFGSTGGGDAGAAKSMSFALGSTPAQSATPTLGGLGTGVAFGASATTTAPTQANITTSSAAPLNFNFGPTPGAAATTTATATTTTALGLTKTTAAPVMGLGGTGIAPSATGGFANLSTATKTTDSASVANAAQMSYNQLEEHINKWTLELEEQEKVFTDQATQINAWDKVLISNNQKILELNDAVQKVKSDQQMLEQELEFIATQHKELEDSIVPLQKEFMKIPQVDVERSQTYLLVENLDTQLKQMSEDLKEIIDNLNEANKVQDNTDPIMQIGKILNAHMSSLQWIESSSSNICNKLDDITKMHETFKRDTERSFRSAYYN